MFPPSSLVITSGMEPDDLLLRASNEGLRRPRVARAQKIIRLHPLLRGGSVSTGDQPVYPFSIRHLAFLEKLIQNLVFLFGVFVVLERFCEIVQCTFSLP